MKGQSLFLIFVFIFGAALSGRAQVDLGKVFKRSKERTDRQIERRIENKIDKAVDKTLDDAEDGVKKDKKNKKGKENKSDKTDKPEIVGGDDNAKPNNNQSPDNKSGGNTEPKAPQNTLVWNKFDFVPGDVIIFEDNLQGEKNGEFPSKWDLVSGSIETANFNGENVIMFINSNTNSSGGIVPLMKNRSDDYLPDEFTIEFDAYFDQPNRLYRVLFYDGKNQSNLNRSVNKGSGSSTDRVRFEQNKADYDDTYVSYPGFGQNSSEDAANSKPGWRRISISFNKRALKLYIDDARVLNIPNVEYNPLGITIAYHNPGGGHQGYIKNIRIAQGAVPLYDKFLTDGKIITTGIRFDVAKATLRPESMGVINEIYNLMTKHTELNFSVEGHTDSDGNAESNLKLSQDRALAVMNQLISMGIDKSRLKYQGFGLTNPIADNSSAEGKAQNRRVEFIKF